MNSSITIGRTILLTLSASMILGFDAGTANAQGLDIQYSEITSKYTWTYWADRQGPYPADGSIGQGNNRRRIKRAIRFINIEYNGRPDPNLWSRAFREAAAFYKKENISYHRGGDGDFFTVTGLSNSRQRIVGWVDDTTGDGAYAVITYVTTSKVYYSMSDGRSREWRADPSNFEERVLGYMAGDWDAGREIYAAIQLWKHTDFGTQAAVSFRLQSRSAR